MYKPWPISTPSTPFAFRLEDKGVEANEDIRGLEIVANEEDKDLGRSPVLRYQEWLPAWNQLTALAPTRPCVPDTACLISTPLIAAHWSRALEKYPNRDLAGFFIRGINKDSKLASHMAHNLLSCQSAIWKEHSLTQMWWKTTCK